MFVATCKENKRRGKCAPIRTKRTWRLSWALVCLLLILGWRRRCRWPVSMSWIHVGFTTLAGVKEAWVSPKTKVVSCVRWVIPF
jgi:hypothetical protein